MRLTAIIGLILIGCGSALAQQTQPSAHLTPQEIRERMATFRGGGGGGFQTTSSRLVKITLAESVPFSQSSGRFGSDSRRPGGDSSDPNSSFNSLMSALWSQLDPGGVYWNAGFQQGNVVVIELRCAPSGGLRRMTDEDWAKLRAEANKALDLVVQKLKDAAAKPQMSAEQIRKQLAGLDADLNKNAIETSVYQAINSSRQQLWPGILMEQIKDSELQKRRLEMDLAAKEVRVKLLTRQIKQIEEEANKKIEADPVLAQLKRVVDLRKQAMDRSKRLAEQHAISQEDISKTEEQLLEAQIRLAERMETLRQNTKADLLNRLSSDLATLMIDMAEMNAKLSLINKEPQIDLAKLDEKKLDELYEQYKSYFLAPQQQTVRDRLRARREQLLADKMRLLIKDVEVIPEDAAR